MLNKCQLFDIRSQGPMFIWTNNQQFPNRIMERLDKATANSQWRMMFPKAYVEVVLFLRSDHLPIALHLSPSPKPFWKRPFKFEWF